MERALDRYAQGGIVQVLVTRAGEVREAARQEIYRSYACFDYGVLTLDED